MTRVAAHRHALLGLVLALVAVGPVAGAVSAQDPPAAAQDAAVDEAREGLADGSVDPLEMPMLARTLLEAGELESLRELLRDGSDHARLGILAAMNSLRAVVLVEEVLSLAAGSGPQEVQRKALDNLRRMACADSGVRATLVADLSDERRSEAESVAIIGVLGGCRDLSVVEPLLAQLEGNEARAQAAHRALAALTGLDPARPQDADGWRSFWAGRDGRTREELIEAALERDREQHRIETERLRIALRAAVTEVEQSRIVLMGTEDVERLRAGLSDDYARVREVAAQRLAAHPDPDLAVAAVPALLERLGVSAADGTNGHEPVREPDPAVRAAVVAALGVLGRGRPEVMPVLIAELSSPHVAVSSAAVSALARVRSTPEVVRPLLELLDRLLDQGTVGEDTTRTVLGIIAENRPQGVLAELERHLSAAPSPAVRSGVARALLACDELGEALDLVETLAVPEEHVDVRFGLAGALGVRARGLGDQPDLRARAVSILARLAADPSPSVRAEAARALGESGDQAALAVLESRLKAETEPDVMQRLVRSLGDLGSLDGVDAIGRRCAGRPTGDAVWEEGRKALLAICADRSGADLWTVAQTLDELRADQLALVVLQLIIAPTKPIPGQVNQLVPQALGLKAELLVRTGQLEAAHDLLVTIHDQPEAAYPDALRRVSLLADLCEQLGRPAEAADFHQQHLALLPPGDARRMDVRRRLADALWRAGLHERALPEAEALHAAAPEDNALMYRLAQVRMALGDDAAARELLERLLPRIADTPDGAELLGLVRADLQRLEPAPAEPPVAPPAEPAAEDGAPAAEGSDDGAGA